MSVVGDLIAPDLIGGLGFDQNIQVDLGVSYTNGGSGVTADVSLPTNVSSQDFNLTDAVVVSVAGSIALSPYISVSGDISFSIAGDQNQEFSFQVEAASIGLGVVAGKGASVAQFGKEISGIAQYGLHYDQNIGLYYGSQYELSVTGFGAEPGLSTNHGVPNCHIPEGSMAAL